MYSYLSLMSEVAREGVKKGDRTGTGTMSLFGAQFRHDLNNGFPLMTTKKMHFKGIANELIWFLSGSTNVKWLNENGVTIWNEWAGTLGELGPIYGAQWTNWRDHREFEAGINQIDGCLDLMKNDPDSRRILFHAWNVAELEEMALPPCHILYQFYVHDGKLSAHLYMRSSDVFLGLPYNIASLALLTHMFAAQSGLGVGEIVISFGDIHIYDNHREQCVEQLGRLPKKLPRIVLDTEVKSMYDYRYESFKLEGYDPHPAIKAPIAI